MKEKWGFSCSEFREMVIVFTLFQTTSILVKNNYLFTARVSMLGSNSLGTGQWVIEYYWLPENNLIQSRSETYRGESNHHIIQELFGGANELAVRLKIYLVGLTCLTPPRWTVSHTNTDTHELWPLRQHADLWQIVPTLKQNSRSRSTETQAFPTRSKGSHLPLPHIQNLHHPPLFLRFPLLFFPFLVKSFQGFWVLKESNASSKPLLLLACSCNTNLSTVITF